MDKPTFVLVPGCWHVPAHFDLVRNELESAGFRVDGVHLPANTYEPRVNGRLLGIADDVNEIRRVVISHLDSGEDVVVVSHSYGSIPATASTKGLSKQERKTNGVVASVIISGFLLEQGTTMLQVMGGQLAPQYLHENDTTLPFSGPGAIHVLFNDVEHNEALKAVWKLKPQSYGINESPVPDQLAGLKGIPLWYLMTSEDNALPWEWQHSTIKSYIAAGIQVEVQYAPTGHSPFLIKPVETANFLRRAAGENVVTGFSEPPADGSKP